MPLIRYEIGDASRWAEEQTCPCGRNLPLLENIEGRTTEFLVMPDGRVISGPALTLIVADLHDVAQVQFVQETEREVQLRVVPGTGYGEHSRLELRRRLGLYLKDAVRLTLVEVEAIRKEPSGKYRFVVNRLQENETTTTQKLTK
jgi:phenylacetate-CoA ligase